MTGTTEGMIEEFSEAILELFKDLSGALPENLKGRILSEKDGDVLRQYVKLVKTAASLDKFIERVFE